MAPTPAPSVKPSEANPNVGLFTRRGTEFDLYRPSHGEPLPTGTYIIRVAQMRGFYLDRQEDLSVPGRVYGACPAERIMSAYRARAREGTSTGVWLNGEKGAGKTMLAGVLSERARAIGMPTILVQMPFHGPEFNSVLEHLPPSCVIFDEFEKVYNEDEEKNGLLTVFAGSVMAQHLYVITTNEEHKVSVAMRNRPSRMRYFIDYRGVNESTVKEYVNDRLKDKSRVAAMIEALKQVPECNFDIMQSAVEEHNHVGGEVEEMLALMNITRYGKTRWSLSFKGKINGKSARGTGTWHGNLPDYLRNDTVCTHFRLNVVIGQKGRGIEKRSWNLGIDPESDPIIDENGSLIYDVIAEGTGKLVFTPDAHFSNWEQRF